MSLPLAKEWAEHCKKDAALRNEYLAVGRKQHDAFGLRAKASEETDVLVAERNTVLAKKTESTIDWKARMLNDLRWMEHWAKCREIDAMVDANKREHDRITKELDAINVAWIEKVIAVYGDVHMNWIHYDGVNEGPICHVGTDVYNSEVANGVP